MSKTTNKCTIMSEKELNQLLDALSNVDDDCKISNVHEDFELEEVMEFCFRINKRNPR